MPFLRLTRDRRGYENTFLMHADRPGDRPRILYWYRTAPGIQLGRPPLDEDAIRVIEEQHPDIEFDWPAILALSEVMTPEEEATPPRPRKEKEKERKARRGGKGRRDISEDTEVAEVPRMEATERTEASEVSDVAEVSELSVSSDRLEPSVSSEPIQSPRNLLVEELAGREVGARLRARHADIVSRIEALDVDGAEKDALFRRAEAIDPELWMTPEAVLEGVRGADAVYEQLKAEVTR